MSKYKLNKELILKELLHIKDEGEYFNKIGGGKLFWNQIYESYNESKDTVFLSETNGSWSRKYLLNIKEIHNNEFKDKMNDLLKGECPREK